MTYDEIRLAWNAQSDENNQWDELVRGVEAPHSITQEKQV